MRGRPATCDCGTCPKCKHRIYMRDWNARHPGYAAAMVRRRRRSDPDAARKRDRDRWQQRTRAPDWRVKRAAQTAVSNAIRDGRLEKGECEVNDARCDGGVEAHHDDYSKPLEVRWLCVRHHNDEHRTFF